MLLIIGLAVLSITSCERAMTKPVMDAVTPSEMPITDDPEAFAVAFVQAAVDLYKTAGREATIVHYNDPASIDGQWYVFITDENDLYLAHPLAPGFLGKGHKGDSGALWISDRGGDCYGDNRRTLDRVLVAQSGN